MGEDEAIRCDFVSFIADELEMDADMNLLSSLRNGVVRNRKGGSR